MYIYNNQKIRNNTLSSLNINSLWTLNNAWAQEQITELINFKKAFDRLLKKNGTKTRLFKNLWRSGHNTKKIQWIRQKVQVIRVLRLNRWVNYKITVMTSKQIYYSKTTYELLWNSKFEKLRPKSPQLPQMLLLKCKTA